MGLRIISGGAGGGAAGVTSIAANGGVARSGVLGIIGVGGVQIVDNGDGTFTFRSNLTFAGLGDVQLAGLANGQVPIWNAAAAKWENGPIPTGDAAWIAVLGGIGFTNGWSNVGAGHPAASYRKDGQGVVHLQGVIQGGALNASAFTLPAGYRPGAAASGHDFITRGNNAAPNATGLISIVSDGTVTIFGDGVHNAYNTLDGITFLAEN